MFSPSEDVSAAEIVQLRLGVFETWWWLMAECGCKTTQIILHHEAKRYGEELVLIDYITRLRCPRCRQAPRRTRITNGPCAGSNRAPINMQLTG